MAGKPFKVGRFAHTLRVRLMREHVGVDVDGLDEEDLMANNPVTPEHGQTVWDPDSEQEKGQVSGVTRVAKSEQRTAAGALFSTTLDGIEQGHVSCHLVQVLFADSFSLRTAIQGTGEASSGSAIKVLRKMGLASNQAGHGAGDQTLTEERKTFTRDGQEETGFASAVIPTLEEKTVAANPPQQSKTEDEPPQVGDKLDENNGQVQGSNDTADTEATTTETQPSQARTVDGELFGAPAGASSSAKTDDEVPHSRSGIDDADEEEQAAPDARANIRRHLGSKLGNKTWTLLTPKPKIDPQGFEDPISNEFWKNVWVASAVHNVCCNRALHRDIY